MNHAQAICSPFKTNHIEKANKDVPLQAARANLQIFLTGTQPETQLITLLHSPIGVYVTATRNVHDMIEVMFEIAHEDFDFTLHMLLATVSEATIGAIVQGRTVTIQ